MIDQPLRSTWLTAVFAALALGACGPGASPDGGTTPDTGGGGSDVITPGGDSTTDLDATAMDDSGATDGRRVRDTGPEISLMGTCDRCFVSVTPTSGPGGTTFTVTGSRFCGTTVATYIVPGTDPSTACIGVTRMMMRDLTITPDPADPPTGTFMSTFMGSFGAGQYVFCAGRPLAEPCTGGGPFTVR